MELESKSKRVNFIVGYFCEGFVGDKVAVRCFYGVIVIWFIGLVVALFAPDEILTMSSFLDVFVRIISLVLPIERFASKANYVDVARLYYSVIWLTFIPFIYLLWRNLWTRKKGLLVKPKSTMTIGNWAFLVFLVLPFMSIMLWTIFSFFNGGDARMAKFGSSRPQLGFWGIGIPWLAAWCVTTILATIKRIFT